MENRTKIICTIGPASQDKRTLEKMMHAGMDCARLNFSHGTYAQHAQIIKNVREISKKNGKYIGILQDLQGPKIRLGELPERGIQLREGETITLSTKKENGTLPVQYKKLPSEVKRGDTLLVNDGLIELTVEKSHGHRIECRVKVGGLVTSFKGINVPGVTLSAKPFTDEDRKDAAFGAKHRVDFVALSFVREAKDIHEARKFLERHGSKAAVIAKIERIEAIENLEEIVEAADAVMVARGDLGLEAPAEQVPLLQKKIIHVSNEYGRPVIVATQMLNSMVESPRATRAEISDAATAIFDHSDSFMLANETAVGKYPVEAVATLRRVAATVEHDLAKHPHLLQYQGGDELRIMNATCLNATKLAKDIRAKFLIAITRSGYTLREIAKYRPFIPLIVFTPDPTVARQASIVWGAVRSFVQYIHLDNPIPQIRKTLIAHKLVKAGDEIVVCNAGFGKKEKLITTTMI